MAIKVKHATEATVEPSGEHEIDTPQWNEPHLLELSAGRLVGRTTAGEGDAEEISVGPSLSLTGLTLSFDNAWGDARYAAAGHNHSGVYLESETDPVFGASAAAGITSANINNWNTAHGWGNHASAGYVPGGRVITAGTGLSGGGNLTANRTINVSFGTAAGTVAQGNDSRINNGQTAFGWGNHASAGYAPSARTLTAGTGLTGGGDLTANRSFNVTYGTAANTAAQGNDPRLENNIRSNAETTVNAHTRWANNQQVRLGGGANMRMFHTGSHAFFDVHTGNLYVRDAGTTRFTFERTNGQFTATGDVRTSSDRRLKDDIEPIQDALAKLSQVVGYTYRRKDLNMRQAGLIAQELQEVLPEAVSTGDDGMLSVAYAQVTALLVNAVREQQQQIEQLQEVVRGLTK